MLKKIIRWFERECPQNLLLARPVTGAVIVTVFCFSFLVLYRPFGTAPARYFSYEATMAIYCLVAGLSVFLIIYGLGRLHLFSPDRIWTIGREVLAVIFVLIGLGFAIYAAGFLVEGPVGRLNFATLLDSMKNAFLVGLVPFLFFSAMNMRYWFGDQMETFSVYGTNRAPAGQSSSAGTAGLPNERIIIDTPLKKERFECHPDELLFVESYYNYVNFYLIRDDKVQKEVIRITISNVEEQLHRHPNISRVHRAYLVNLDKIETATGNSMGYRLKLAGLTKEIPVSRRNVPRFRRLYEAYR